METTVKYLCIHLLGLLTEFICIYITWFVCNTLFIFGIICFFNGLIYFSALLFQSKFLYLPKNSPSNLNFFIFPRIHPSSREGKHGDDSYKFFMSKLSFIKFIKTIICQPQQLLANSSAILFLSLQTWVGIGAFVLLQLIWFRIGRVFDIHLKPWRTTM